MSKKILVAYFSGSGVTARAAKALAEAANADIYEIEPVTPYTRADLFWPNPKCRSITEMRNSSYRPPIKDTDAKIADYDIILLGYPLWCHTIPTIVNTFLEKYDFSGKKIILFETSGGNGFCDSVQGVRKSVDASCQVEEGKMLNRYTPESLKAWVEQIG